MVVFSMKDAFCAWNILVSKILTKRVWDTIILYRYQMDLEELG